MQRTSSVQLPWMAKAGSCQQTPVAAETSPCVGFGPGLQRTNPGQQPWMASGGSCQPTPIDVGASSCLGFGPSMETTSTNRHLLLLNADSRQYTPIAAGASPCLGFRTGPGQQPPTSQHIPIAAEPSPCLGFSIVPLAAAFPVIAVPYPPAPTTAMWQECEAPKQACQSPASQNEDQSWQEAAEEQPSWPALSSTGLAGSLSRGGASRGPCFGNLHRFHHSMASMGILSPDLRSFTKTQNKNRLSIVCEDRVHGHGVTRYAVQFTHGELSNADGVGFILSSDVPCTKNIQKIVSLFVNKTGRICVRTKQEVDRISARVKAIEVGDWLEVISDLEQLKLIFIVWPRDNSAPSSVTVGLRKLMENANQRWPCGYLAVVMKHVGVSVALAS